MRINVIPPKNMICVGQAMPGHVVHYKGSYYLRILHNRKIFGIDEIPLVSLNIGDVILVAPDTLVQEFFDAEVSIAASPSKVR